MLNPERIDWLDNGYVELEFTTESADHGVTISLSQKDAMQLAHRILSECSYAAQLKRKKY